jgi:hypothetical protein
MDLFSELRLSNRRLFDKFCLKEFFVDFVCSLMILVVLMILNLSKIDDCASLGIDCIIAFGHIIVPGSKWRVMYLSLERSVLFLSRVDMRLLWLLEPNAFLRLLLDGNLRFPYS